MNEKTVSIELTKNELLHLINNTIACIYNIKQSVFGDIWNFGTDITEVEILSNTQKEKLIAYGYYSRKELLNKLEQIKQDNFEIPVCCS